MPWFAGNLHCHSTFSDGDAEPREVAQWYRDHGYSFVSLTDHNGLTPTEAYSLDTPDFIEIPGAEYSCQKGCHVNGIGINHAVSLPTVDMPASDMLQEGIDGIRAQGGLSIVNHPNWLWSLDANDLKQLKNAQFFEVWNGGPTSNNAGRAGSESTDDIWDALLSEGIGIYGIAADDAHDYNDIPVSPRGIRDAPGTAWVWVHAETLSCEAILSSMQEGDFIASTGVKLKTLHRSPTQIAFEIDPPGKYTFHRTTFIGNHGAVLSEQDGLTVSYTPQKDDVYVRARIESSCGTRGWVQPVYVHS